MFIRYMDTRKGWYVPNLLNYWLQAKNFPLFWSYTWKYNIEPNKRLTKVKEKSWTIKFDVFVLSFIFFVPMSQTISAINVSGACYFLQASNKWRVCWHVCMRSHMLSGEDCMPMMTLNILKIVYSCDVIVL